MAKEQKERPAKKEKPPKKERVSRAERKAKKAKGSKEETLLQKLKRQKEGKIYPEDEPEVAEEAPAEGQEEAPAKKKSKLILLIGAAVLLLAAIAIVVIFVILPRFSGDKEPEESESPEPVLYDLPANFQVGEETVAGLQPVNPDGVQAELDPRVSYTYTGLSDTGAEVEAYVTSLKAEKFSVVDAEFVRTDPPDYSTPEGSVLLARNIAKPKKDTGSEGDASASPAPDQDADASGSPAPGQDADASGSPAPGQDADASGSPAPDGDTDAAEEKDMVLTVQLDWSGDSMVVTCDQAEGRVTSPARQPGSAIPGASMTMSEAVDFLYKLDPSVLGLTGTSMDSYRIYALDGAVMVNNQPCMRLSIYSREGPEQTNELAGIYLLTRDGTHLYELDESAGTVKEVKLP